MNSSGNVKSKEVRVCFLTCAHTHTLPFWTHRSRPLLMLRKLHLLDLEAASILEHTLLLTIAEVKTNLIY